MLFCLLKLPPCRHLKGIGLLHETATWPPILRPHSHTGCADTNRQFSETDVV